MVGQIRNIQNKLVTILKTISPLQNRVYVFPSTKEQISSKLPRVTVSLLTPPETFGGLGSNVTGLPAWGKFTCKVDVWDKDPENVDVIADNVLSVVQSNRCAVGTSGFWLMLKCNGGTITSKVENQQLYLRSMNIVGWWLQTS